MTGDTWNLGVLNELDRIRAARVLRDADVGVIDHSIFIEHDVLKHGAEAQRLENIRLVFRRKIDRLGVATSFDVENSVVAPAMLIVADEMAFRVGGEGRFARAAQAEEQARTRRSFCPPWPSNASKARPVSARNNLRR